MEEKVRLRLAFDVPTSTMEFRLDDEGIANFTLDSVPAELPANTSVALQLKRLALCWHETEMSRETLTELIQEVESYCCMQIEVFGGLIEAGGDEELIGALINSLLALAELAADLDWLPLDELFRGVDEAELTFSHVRSALN